jgi:hypothetical protein
MTDFLLGIMKGFARLLFMFGGGCRIWIILLGLLAVVALVLYFALAR